jgi:hypothetical protein
MPILEA